ncbi:unnamed protein product [Microthlaspi erraticum]|uniref:Disease resistance R13L4/SHOC-2-like LRR domain-containing protein n=1 Tax=Microthlaspi erraticum TaxID=1685480 RepID=A0A6D2I4J4_9BRAS|nr:unnamed protein product [Microthlaspi erraticum]
MRPGKCSRCDTDGYYTIHSINKVLSHLYRVIPLQDANQETDESVVEEGISEVGLERAKSAPASNHSDPVNRIFKIQSALTRLKFNLKHVKRLQVDVETELNRQLDSLKRVVEEADPPGALHMSLIESELEEITKKLLDLIGKVSVLHEGSRKKKTSPDDDQDSVLLLPDIPTNEEDLIGHAFFKDVKHKVQTLSSDSQTCLLSFAVFPENREINGTMLMYWWIGEGILPDKLKPEEAMKKILKEFMDRNLIEPLVDRRKRKPSSYKMTPFVHFSVVYIAKERGLFDLYNKDQKPSMKKSNLKKVCLVEGSSSQTDAKAKKMAPADIETVFNVSESYPDFIIKWFSSMKLLKVLYLGRWERNEREIEVDSRGLMKDLSAMRELRFLSFQGISTIMRISPSACKLPELVVLDLRGCYNLEKLPDDIHNLTNLVYLDLTGCDALESIPTNLTKLLNLEVLKGFVVADEREIACKLVYLKNLWKLRKLSVRVDRKGFGLKELIVAIDGFEELEKLKVLWGRVKPGSKKKLEDDEKERTFRSVNLESDEFHLPLSLRKLDLRRFPDNKLPVWLQPQNLINLKKLHLGSSRRLKALSDSLPKKPSNCSVKVLRLMCFQKLNVNWIELKEIYFPNLRLLEIYQCPRVTFSPCDRDGIWRAD